VAEGRGEGDRTRRWNQAILEQQYEKAVRENKIVVFVRDTQQKRLVSFSMDYGSADGPSPEASATPRQRRIRVGKGVCS
jgi:hypothetical protein